MGGRMLLTMMSQFVPAYRTKQSCSLTSLVAMFSAGASAMATEARAEGCDGEDSKQPAENDEVAGAMLHLQLTKREKVDDVGSSTSTKDGGDIKITKKVVRFGCPFKLGYYRECKEAIPRESTPPPPDSGRGSPRVPDIPVPTDNSFKCVCGKKALFVCACRRELYCGIECQLRDWRYHRRLCRRILRRLARSQP